MGDLISRKAVLDEIHKYFRERIDRGIYEIDVVDCSAKISKRISNIHTAYDVDKVIIEMKDYQDHSDNDYVDDAIDDLIEIIKEGDVKDE